MDEVLRDGGGKRLWLGRLRECDDFDGRFGRLFG